MTRIIRSTDPRDQMTQAEIDEIMAASAARELPITAREYEALRDYAFAQILLDDDAAERREDQLGRLRRRRR